MFVLDNYCSTIATCIVKYCQSTPPPSSVLEQYTCKNKPGWGQIHGSGEYEYPCLAHAGSPNISDVKLKFGGPLHE